MSYIRVGESHPEKIIQDYIYTDRGNVLVIKKNDSLKNLNQFYSGDRGQLH